jgi:hypothetical protein
MKKVLFIASMFICTVAISQDFQIGAKAGVNISNFTGGDFGTVEKEALIGYHAGAFIRFRFGKLVLQPELLVSTQGAKLESAGNSEDYKLTYLNIPIMLQYETNGGFYVEAGPQFGAKIDESVPNTTTEDFAESMDIAICFGLGYHFRFGLGIGARYNVGVSKVGDFDAAAIDPDFKNGVAQFSLFYTIFNNNKKAKAQ